MQTSGVQGDRTGSEISVVGIPEVQLISRSKLKVDGKNPNKMSKKQFSSLKISIEKYGFLVPIITNKEYIIADGEHRLKAAEELGIDEVPTIVLDIEEVDRRILRQILNKLRGEHDRDLDLEEYRFINE